MPDSVPTTDSKLIPSTALFRFEIPCGEIANYWEPQGPCELPQQYALPDFQALDGQPRFADIRLAWSRRGIAISAAVAGKQRPPWCHKTRLEDSDGLTIWLSTRETDAIHRANRFCHQFVMLPRGRGARLDQPVMQSMAIQRAAEMPKSLPDGALQIRSESRKNGYRMRAAIPAAALTGFDPQEHRRLAFSYAVMDQELGVQFLCLGKEYPIATDPSLWVTLVLV